MNNNQVRIFDRNNYQKKTMDCFEVMGAYFVDIYYNHLFIEGKKLRTNKSASSITEGYKHALNAFLQGVENPKTYKKILVGIHSFFISSGFTSISFSDCIERVTEEFIPKDYFASVSKQQKISILKLVICQSNKTFVEKLVKNYLKLVIDTHSDADNIRILQDVFIDILMLERENIYHRFISTQKNDKSAPNTSLIEAMQAEIKKLCKEKFELKKLTTSLKQIIINKENDLCDHRAMISELKSARRLVDESPLFTTAEDIIKSTPKPTKEFVKEMRNVYETIESGETNIGDALKDIQDEMDSNSNSNSNAYSENEDEIDTTNWNLE